MAKTKQPQPDTTAAAPAAMMAAFSPNPDFAKAWMDMMSDSARVASDQMRTHLEAQAALMACRTPAEVMKVQVDYLNAIIRMSAEETARSLRMTMGVSGDIAGGLTTGRSRDYDDVPV
jgi:hypothetical protein